MGRMDKIFEKLDWRHLRVASKYQRITCPFNSLLSCDPCNKMFPEYVVSLTMSRPCPCNVTGNTFAKNRFWQRHLEWLIRGGKERVR